MFNIKETVYEEKVIGQSATDICQVISIKLPKITISSSQIWMLISLPSKHIFTMSLLKIMNT